MPSSKEHFAYTYSEWMNEPFKRMFLFVPNNIKVVYDVGACAGGWSGVAKVMFPQVDIYAFEPVRENFAELKELSDIYAFNFGILYGVSVGEALWRGSNHGAIFVKEANPGDDCVAYGQVLEFKTFEELALPQPDLIKLDVEGAETNIIENSSLIKRTNYLIIEWHSGTDFESYAKKYLPKHRIVYSIDNRQFLLVLDTVI